METAFDRDWAEVTDELRSLGLAYPAAAVTKARENGCEPSDVLTKIEHYRPHAEPQGPWGPGLLYSAVCKCRPGQKAAVGFPPIASEDRGDLDDDWRVIRERLESNRIEKADSLVRVAITRDLSPCNVHEKILHYETRRGTYMPHHLYAVISNAVPGERGHAGWPDEEQIKAALGREKAMAEKRREYQQMEAEGKRARLDAEGHRDECEALSDEEIRQLLTEQERAALPYMKRGGQLWLMLVSRALMRRAAQEAA